MWAGPSLSGVIKTSLFEHPWMLFQVTLFMSPLWDKTLPGRTPAAATEKWLCAFAFVWSQSTSAQSASSPNSTAGWMLPHHLMMCCQDKECPSLCLVPDVLHWDVLFGAFQLLLLEKKSVNMILSSSPCTCGPYYILSDPSSSKMSAFNLPLHRGCSLFLNLFLLPLSSSFPVLPFPETVCWCCAWLVQMWCGRIPGRSLASFPSSIPVPPNKFFAVAELAVWAE